MIPVIAILVTFGVPAIVIIVLANLRHQQRLEMIRHGINPDVPAPQSLNYPGKKSLLWGLLLTAVGLAAFISSLNGGDHDLNGIGLFLAGAGIALLIYWKLTEPDREHARRRYEEHQMTSTTPGEHKDSPASEPGNTDMFR